MPDTNYALFREIAKDALTLITLFYQQCRFISTFCRAEKSPPMRSQRT
jgi:hypothetical protein